MLVVERAVPSAFLCLEPGLGSEAAKGLAAPPESSKGQLATMLVARFDPCSCRNDWFGGSPTPEDDSCCSRVTKARASRRSCLRGIPGYCFCICRGESLEHGVMSDVQRLQFRVFRLGCGCQYGVRQADGV